MAWTAPRTWVTSELVTSTLLNTHLRDNLLMLENKYQTTLPGSPFDGQWTILVDSTTAPTYSWQLRYNSTLAKWEFMGGRAAFAEVVTAELTSSSSYAALATAGPSITLPVAGTYEISQGCSAYYNSGSYRASWMSYDIGGTGAVDADAVLLTNGSPDNAVAGTPYASSVRTRVKTGLTAVALTSKYKTTAGTSLYFQNRWLRVTPVTL